MTIVNLMNVLTPILQGDAISAISNGLQIYQDQISKNNLDNCLSILETKINHTIFNGDLPVLESSEHNLMLSVLVEMQSTYTIEKQECIANLITNMLYEKKNGTFDLYTYQVVFDQLKQMFDPEISLLLAIYSNKDSLWINKNNNTLLSVKKIRGLEEYSEYRIQKLENLAFLKSSTGFGSLDDNRESNHGEYVYNKQYFNTFYNKVCTLLYNE